jgi:tetratricopeptide (TPR) repeat protein
VPPPLDPTLALRVRELRARLADARMLDRVGNAPSALEHAEAVARDASGLGDPAIEAEAWCDVGQIAVTSLGRTDLARVASERAIHAAIASHHDVVAVRAWTTLMFVDGVLQEQFDAALKWNAYAVAVLSRLRDDALDADRLYVLSYVYNHTGRNRDALAAIRQALSSYEKRVGTENRRTAAARMQLALYLQDDAQFGEARQLAERAFETKRHLFGPSHPVTAAEEINLAVLLRDQQLYALSLHHLENALQVLERQPVAPATHAEALASLGAVLLRLGRDGEARQRFQRALELTHRTSERVAVLTGLAELDHRAGDDTEALEELKRALSLVKPTDVVAADALRQNADIELDRGNAERALEIDRRALELIEHAWGPRSFRAAPMLRGIGAALLAVGDQSGAEPVLARALPLVSSLPGGDAERKRVEELLARARGSAPKH